jgi:hypothetical protein
MRTMLMAQIVGEVEKKRKRKISKRKKGTQPMRRD